MLDAAPARLSDSQLKDIFADYTKIAVVGLSANPMRPSHLVASYLVNHGYTIYPVNPALERVLDRTCYPDLASIPDQVEVVDVFRRSEFMPEIAREAVAAGAKMLWMQQGVISPEARRIAEDAGLLVMEDACIKIEHHRVGPRRS